MPKQTGVQQQIQNTTVSENDVYTNWLQYTSSSKCQTQFRDKTILSKQDVQTKGVQQRIQNDNVFRKPISHELLNNEFHLTTNTHWCFKANPNSWIYTTQMSCPVAFGHLDNEAGGDRLDSGMTAGVSSVDSVASPELRQTRAGRPFPAF